MLPCLLIIAANMDPVKQVPPPVNLTAAQDHARLLKELGIDALRPGVDGMNPDSPNFANTDGAKANPYPDIPDALKFRDGKPVKSRKEWDRRRKEILDDMDREIYGRPPSKLPKVRWTVEGEEGNTRRLIGRVDNASYPAVTVEIKCSLTLPEKAKGPVPVIIEFGFPGFRRPRNSQGPTWQDQVLAKGAIPSWTRPAFKRITAAV